MDAVREAGSELGELEAGIADGDLSRLPNVIGTAVRFVVEVVGLSKGFRLPNS
jgi:hypothetical protein